MAVVAAVGHVGAGCGVLCAALTGQGTAMQEPGQAGPAPLCWEGQWLGDKDEEPVTVVHAPDLGQKPGQDAKALAALARRLRELGRLRLLLLVVKCEAVEVDDGSSGATIATTATTTTTIARSLKAAEQAMRLLEGCFGAAIWRHTSLVFTGPPVDPAGRTRLQVACGSALAERFPALAGGVHGPHRLSAYFVDAEAAVRHADGPDAMVCDAAEAAEAELWQLAALAKALPDLCTADLCTADPLPPTLPATPVHGVPGAMAAQSQPMQPDAPMQPVQPPRPAPQAGQPVTCESAEIGAVVERGPAWRWADQDGGVDGFGRIVQVRNGWAVVQWDAGSSNSYRLGTDGLHDLLHVGDSAVAKKEEELRRLLNKADQRGRCQVHPRYLRRTFGYACGTRRSRFARFDIRDEVCEAVGGFKHGQMVTKQLPGGQQVKALTIGVKPDDGVAKLWFHLLEGGAEGAGLFMPSELPDLRAFSGRQRVEEARREDFKAAVDEEEDNEEMLQLANSLQLTFRYPRGTNLGDPSMFDIRDDVCMRVGGFKHGQVLKLDGHPDMVVVGVQLNDEDGLAQLFFHMDGYAGAGTFPREQFAAVRAAFHVSGCRELEALPEEPEQMEQETPDRVAALRALGAQLNPTFGYPLGTGPFVRHGLFDITEETCLQVGGYKHGQVVREPSGRKAVAVGVRLEDGMPELFFHCDGNQGAGLYPNYERFRRRLVADGSRELQAFAPDDPVFGSGLAGLLGRASGRESDRESGGGQEQALAGLLRLLGGDRGGLRGQEQDALPEDFVFDFTFWFPVGRVSFDGYHKFDIRPEVCRRVGGFEHGQVVREPDGDESVVIGVLPDSRTGEPRLWFHSNSAFGAFQIGHYQLIRRMLKVVGTRTLTPRGPRKQCLPDGFLESLQPTFRYACGLDGRSTALFDIRDEVCLAVGGFSHGQVVKGKDGRELLVIGVRVNDSGRAQLWFRPRDCRGAGLLDSISEDPELAGQMLQNVGNEVLTETPEGTAWSPPLPLRRAVSAVSEPEAED